MINIISISLEVLGDCSIISMMAPLAFDYYVDFFGTDLLLNIVKIYWIELSVNMCINIKFEASI